MSDDLTGGTWQFNQPGTEPTYTINEIGKWYAIWPMAIALAWSNSSFREELLANPRRTLEKHLGYTFPETITLTIKESPTGWRKPPGGPGQWELPPSEVTLWLPPAPEDVNERVIALGNYGATGQTYPFTCCKVVC